MELTGFDVRDNFKISKFFNTGFDCQWSGAMQIHEKNRRTPKKSRSSPETFTTVFPYHQRVFYCRDVHLYKPNYVPEDFNVYVSYPLLYSLGFTLPPLVPQKSYEKNLGNFLAQWQAGFDDERLLDKGNSDSSPTFGKFFKSD
ncbi:hypothetical protein ANCCEY_10833 [Ancylostoma ceylanicum]|uniref:Uncharacterized protein n=1 Tax=Ancylostoma ceylanicum TaxID=53326 RepID=A0A0D6LFU7_9BILA|nr:hypothetical protein ANCCEY_10833 [Ancylostoma ceylanicum]